jgi:hypothetical protein
MADQKGSVVARELRNCRAALPIIVLSGLVPLPGEGLGDVNVWISKPVDPERRSKAPPKRSRLKCSTSSTPT